MYLYVSFYTFILSSLYSSIHLSFHPSISLFILPSLYSSIPSLYPSRCTTYTEQVLSSLGEEEQIQLALRISLQQCSHGTTSAAAIAIDNSETINGFRSQMNLQQLISAGYTRTEAMHILRGNGAMNLLREKERVNRRNGHHTQLHKSSDVPLPLHSSCSTSRGGDKAGTQQNSNKKKDREVGASRGIIPRTTNFISRSPHPPTSIPTQSQTYHPADDHHQQQQQRQPKKTTFLSRFF